MMENDRYSILLVDDEENILSSLKRLFRKEPYRIETASNPDEGLKKLVDGRKFQLIVSDFRMPGKNGVQFLKEAKKICPDTIRMVLSGYADINAIINAVNEGEIYKFITKPWNDDELKIAVKRAVEQYELEKKNRILTEELKVLNKDLEAKVEERTKELKIRNDVLLFSQEVMELLPFAVIGADREGMIALVNRKAGGLFQEGSCPLGKRIQNVFPTEIVELIEEMDGDGNEKKFQEFNIDGRIYSARLSTLGSGNNIRGHILTFLEGEG